MLNYFPQYFSRRAIYCYVITLLLASVLFMKYAMPFQFMLFGFSAVTLFFVYTNKLTMSWWRFSPSFFTKKLFKTAFVIRLLYVVFIYFYYIAMTGQPHAYNAGDELQYIDTASLMRDSGFNVYWDELLSYYAYSDRGYLVWLAIEYLLLGDIVLLPRVIKCVMDAFTCVLMYRLAKRNFGESVGRMAAIFYMMMPNMWYYCGMTLKETEMAFMIILFAERADLVLRSPKIKLAGLAIPGLCILTMTTFRTALAGVMFASLAAGLIFSTTKQLQTWKKVLYTSIFAVYMMATIGVEMIEETQQIWSGRTQNQEVGYQWRAQREGGNEFAKYASATLFAPAIFTIPFSSMVAVRHQENQMMMNGANFIKNIMSGFTIFALISMLFSGDWRKHVLPIALNCGYLVVLTFSTFAHSERFHFPVLGLELLFAAYGISLMKNKHKRWFNIWLVVICAANIGWAWIKLAGRGLS